MGRHVVNSIVRSGAAPVEATPQFSPNWLVRYPRFSTAVLFIVLAVLAFAMLAQERAKYLEGQRYQLLQTIGTYAAAIEATISTGVVSLESIRSELVLDPQMDLNRLDPRIALFLQNYSLFRHIAIAPDLVIRYVYPLAGNQSILNVDYRNIPEQFSAIKKTIELASPVVAGPVNLIQGGTGLALRVPVIQDRGQIWGVIAAIIPLERLLDKVHLASLQSDYYIGLSGRDGDPAASSLFWGDVELEQLPAVTAAIQLPVGQWRLHAYPREPIPWLTPSLRWLSLLALCIILMVCTSVFLILRMVREREQALRTIAFQASYDTLTNLPNRAVFTEQLSRMIKMAQRNQSNLSLLCLDLDEFKQVNESLGHAVGDKLLRAVSERLKSLISEQDLLARLGGDEFVILCPNSTTPEQLEIYAEKIVAAFALPMSVSDQCLSISASIGIAMYPHDGITAGDLLKHADRAMYAAKQIGRNTYHFYDSAMQKEADRFVHLHNEILQGVANNEFFLVYQPIYDVQQQRFNKCEALVRWLHPERGLISPLDFISVAERTGAIRPLGMWILRQALLDTQYFTEMGLQLQVSVNRSSQEFNVNHVADEWLQMIAQAGVDTEQLIFEITESLFMDRISVQQANIVRLHQHGLQLAIDDFGTGYSALNYLSRYPVNFIKIDKSFIVGVDTQDKARSLVAVLINMAKVLEVKVVAEGVETAGQLAVLEQLGCDYIQGYFYSKPLKVTDFIYFMQQNSEEMQ